MAEICASDARGVTDPLTRTVSQITCVEPGGPTRAERLLAHRRAEWPYLTPAARKEYYGTFQISNREAMATACGITAGMPVSNPLPASLIDCLRRQRQVSATRAATWLQGHGVSAELIAARADLI